MTVNTFFGFFTKNFFGLMSDVIYWPGWEYNNYALATAIILKFCERAKFMKVTKFPQSCLKVEKDGGAILIDPGSITTAKFGVKDFGKFDAVLYTHSHFDHLDPDIVDELIATGATLYGNADVCEKVGGGKVEQIDEGEELVIAGFKVQSRHMEHCLLLNGSKTVPNTGFLLDEHLLVSGDSTEDVGWTAEVIAAPVWGPDISFKDATDLVSATKAKKIIPYHFDVVHLEPNSFKQFFQMMADNDVTEVAIIDDAETVEI
jgi:L-ascorbate metabolism protein UlaG (beta-lactamase superfamily)